jgi:hypothetical protein
MYLIIDKDNMLCNRLFVFGHIISSAIEHKTTVVNLGFPEYASLFPTAAADIFCRFPPKRRTILHGNMVAREILWWIIRTFVRIYEKIVRYTRKFGIADPPWIYFVNSGYETTENKTLEQIQQLQRCLDTPEITHVVQRYSLIVIRGPLIRAFSYFEKHSDAIRAYFKPTESCQLQVAKVIHNAKSKGDKIVGVHIRQGDYGHFDGGRHFFTSEQYRKLMVKILEKFSDQKVIFLICSNIKQSEDVFTGVNFLFGTGHITEDLYALAQCDFIVGPPSTYSMWASFYGQVPLYIVRNINHVPNLEDFNIVKG